MPSLRKMCRLPRAQLVLAPNLLFSCCAFCKINFVSSTACSSARRSCLNGAISLYLALKALNLILCGYPVPEKSQIKYKLADLIARNRGAVSEPKSSFFLVEGTSTRRLKINKISGTLSSSRSIYNLNLISISDADSSSIVARRLNRNSNEHPFRVNPTSFLPPKKFTLIERVDEVK